MGFSRTETPNSKAAPVLHPCQRCGACCAKWRVQFYWREAERGDSPHPVPAGLYEELDDIRRAMRGTTAKHRPRCVALGGRIGEEVGCKVYENRPSPCRAFQASFEDGIKNPRCDEARAAHGLRPLTSVDWETPPGAMIGGRQPSTSAPVT